MSKVFRYGQNEGFLRFKGLESLSQFDSYTGYKPPKYPMKSMVSGVFGTLWKALVLTPSANTATHFNDVRGRSALLLVLR